MHSRKFIRIPFDFTFLILDCLGLRLKIEELQNVHCKLEAAQKMQGAFNFTSATLFTRQYTSKISKLFSKKFVNNRKETLPHNLVQKTIVQGFHEVRLTNYRSY